MDVVSELSKCMIERYSERWYNLFVLSKQDKQIKHYCNIIKNTSDIFELSNYMVSFLNAIPESILETCNIHLSKSNLSMDIDESTIDYNAILNEVFIYDSKDKIYYTISRVCRLPSHLKNKWAKLDQDIRSFYIEVIADVSHELYSRPNIKLFKEC